ncbi:MAG: BamA/TamA family outer membrane protein, partial [Planctomycetes bacterium]|nr:BamA/TamA family outer membrane protein [Planctomycetota bacterium]
YLGDVSFVGNSIVNEEELRSAFAPQRNDVFDNKVVTANIANVQRIIRNYGYPKAFIRRDMRIELPTAENELEYPLVHLTLHVYEGKKYRIGRVDINGNRITKDAVVRRALHVYPGDDYKEDNIQESIRQLRRIGLFKVKPPNPVRIAQFYAPTRPDEVDLHVQVEEDGTGEIRSNAAYSSVQNFVFQISYQERNFDLLGLFGGKARGGAQIFKASATTSEQATSFNLSWTNPHLYDGPYSFSTFVTRSEQSLDTADWDEDLIETGAVIGRLFLNNDLLLSLGYTYSNRFIYNVQANAPEDALAANNTTFDLNSISFRQRYSRLDIPRQPTSGYKIDLRETITGGPLSASDEFVELYANIDVFFPIFDSDLGGTTRIHLGQENRWMDPINDTPEVPFYRRIRGGGPSPRHRGFEAGHLGPIELNTTNPLLEPTYLGGTTKWLTTLELIHPLQGYQSGIQGLIFYDLGNVWGVDESANLRDLRSAAGFGIRFPMAFPIALDFAWRLDDKTNGFLEKSSQFHFSIGGVF